MESESHIFCFSCYLDVENKVGSLWRAGAQIISEQLLSGKHLPACQVRITAERHLQMTAAGVNRIRCVNLEVSPAALL